MDFMEKKGGFHLEETICYTAPDMDEGGEKMQQEIEAVAALILEKLKAAMAEPERVGLRRVVKTKQIRYENPDRPDKPTCEEITEEERFRRVKCPIDLGRLKQITAVLKELKELRFPKTELDLQEQRARIAKLEKEGLGEKESDVLQVRFEADLEELSL